MKTQVSTLRSSFVKALWLTVGILAAATLPIQAQELYTIGSQTTMHIEGTSTLHDWTSEVEIVRGQGKFTLEGNKLAGISGLKISIVVKSIKSGKGAMMDNNTYKALKASQYPEIIYELQSVQVLPDQKLSALGKLTIGGVSKTTKMEVGYQVEAGKLSIKGEMPIVMQEFNIDPPTAMMGTIKTGEEVTVVFNAVFTAAKQLSSL